MRNATPPAIRPAPSSRSVCRTSRASGPPGSLSPRARTASSRSLSAAVRGRCSDCISASVFVRFSARVTRKDGIEYHLWRQTLSDGEVTTLYAVRHPARSTRVRVVHFPRTERLDVWCAENGVEEAVVAGFFLRDPYRPLGELWIDGRPMPHEPVAAPYGPRRGTVVTDADDAVRLLERQAAPARPPGDLVQAGPLLVADGEILFDVGDDREGFSAGAGQFDSDITAGRYPRAALGTSERWLIAVACDGRRSNVDGGLSMLELADVMVELGATSALNLDGGGSTTLVHRGHLLNRPYSTQDQPAPASRRVVSALAFEPRAEPGLDLFASKPDA
jgi:Phosphodiester glycosidase